jgi:hypothetical protein
MLDICRKMYHLTELFIASMGPLMDGCIKEEEAEEQRQSSALHDYGRQSSLILEQISSLPSAAVQDHFRTNDWVYEACRIAAVIYTRAITGLEPFSKVGECSHSNASFNSVDSASGRSTTCLPSTQSLPEELFEALRKTDLENVWKDTAGVLYWVCAVGAAAARTPDGINNIDSTIPDPPQSYSVWVRRNLAKHAFRTMAILVPQHPTPIIMAQKKLYRVQELIREASRR